MNSSPSEQQNDSRHSLSLLAISSTKETIHQAFGIFFPTPPRPMTVINLDAASVETIPVSTQNQPATPNPASVMTVTVTDQPSLVNPDENKSHKNNTVPDSSNNLSDNWSAIPLALPSPTMPIPGTAPTQGNPGDVNTQPTWDFQRNSFPFTGPQVHPMPSGQFPNYGPVPFHYPTGPFNTHFQHAGSTYFPPFPPGPHYQQQTNPGNYQPPHGLTPIYVPFREPPKFKLPKDWNRNTNTWPLFKLKTEMACQELNLMFLTTDRETTLTTTEPSKKFSEALHAVVPHTAMADFLGSQRDFYCTRGIEMYQRLRTIHGPTHAGAITAILDQLTNFSMGTTETPSMYKLRIKLLNEWLPHEIAYTQALLGHTVYKGLDKSRYSEFQANVRAGNRRGETVSGLFADLEAVGTLVAIKKHASNPESILKPASAHAVTFKKTSSDTNLTHDWKGQKDLNPNQVGFLIEKFQKGCVICHTNDHKIIMCPIIKDKFLITTKHTNNRNKTTCTTPSRNGSARTTLATIPDDEDEDNSGTTKEINKVKQGKSCHSISSPAPNILSLLPSATSAQNLTPLFIPSQDNILVDELEHADDIDQRGSFQQETLPGPTDVFPLARYE
jgi:hypothetical protein